MAKEIVRNTANRSIKYGFRVHKAGKRMRQAGLTVGGTALGVAGLHAAASHLGTAGRIVDVDPHIRNVGRGLRNLVRIRSPFLAHVIDRYGDQAGQYVGNKLSSRMNRLRRSPKAIEKAQRLFAFGVRHRVAGRSAKTALAGLGIATIGSGISYLGSRMVKHGFRAHPKRLERRARRYFLGR